MGFLLLLFTVSISAREKKLFDENWLFCLGNDNAMSQQSFDDSKWRELTLPHDWAIEGNFSSTNLSGAGGGALPGGIGWYRKHFKVDATNESKIFVSFDGVYMNSTVFVNGNKVGFRPYGYSSFQYDITPFVVKGDNVIAVKVDNSDQPNSRWYSGCGIYRHTWLETTGDTYIKQWGVHVDNGVVDVDVVNPLNKKITIVNSLFDASGKKANLKGKHHLWNIDDPYLYYLKTQLLCAGKIIDEVVTPTGFRSFRFDAKTGFWLNGKNIKINGVCEHHDFGCLGAALNEDALHRKLIKLKDMGVNAIRCSHNPPAPELLNMCDSMGFIVMDESFDMWRHSKTKNDYARFFDEWHERDLSDLVKRDRNHPSIMMWSIGNEVLEQWSSVDADTLTLEQANLILNAGHDASTLAKDGETSVNSLLTQHLTEIVKKNLAFANPTKGLVNTPYVTAGCNEPNPDNHLFKSGALDIIGFNYHHQWIKDVPKNFPGKPFLLSESVSALQTRGFYRMPSDSVFLMPDRWDIPYTDPSMMCSAYDNCHVPWGSTHEETWDIVKHTKYCAGQFIWTGFDYIGEPTPYGFPARSSYFGIIDLAGFPKDTYYMYQSEWTKKPVLHLFPHWNWLKDQMIDMWCYYNNADEVELFVNGKSQGVRSKKDDHQYHVMWRVKFEPGEVKVVARKNNTVVSSQVIRTAGAPNAISLKVDYDGRKYQNHSFGGNDYAKKSNLVFVEVDVNDADGNICPNADNQIQFSVEGADIVGVDNGSPFSLERFKADNRKTFFGKCLVVLRPHGDGGMTLRAQSVDLKECSIHL